jgi:hypothetical protein
MRRHDFYGRDEVSFHWRGKHAANFFGFPTDFTSEILAFAYAIRRDLAEPHPRDTDVGFGRIRRMNKTACI